MAGQRFEIDVDPNFEIHTSYHSDFFLLRTRVLVNGDNTEIRSLKEGKYEGPVLNFRHSGSTVSTKFRLIASTVSPILVQFGVYHVDTFYYEQSPLFHVVFSSELCLKNFIIAIGELKSALEPKLQALFLSNLKTPSAQQLTVKVQLNLFLVSPNRQLIRGAEVHLVTAENCSKFVTCWKDSKLFDFGSLYQEEAKPPKVTSQPMSQNNVLIGKPITFSVQATGTQALSYQWQWKQFGRESEKDGWQNLSVQGSTIQVEVKASNAGYYRCVISNCAGIEMSQCASLTVVPEVHDLEGELHDVIDWIPFGLYLGIRLPELKTIEANYPTLQRRRIEMLQVWQNNAIPTWSAVVQALVGIGMRHLASDLARKHGAPSPKLPDNDPLDQLENILQQEKATVPKLFEQFQKHRGGQLEQDRRKLVATEECLRCAQEFETKMNDKRTETMTKLEELHENMLTIAQEKSNIEMKLNFKEQECELLSKMQGKDETCNQLLQTVIEKKKNKIKRLKEELEKKESELKSAQQEVHTKQEQLSQAQKELKKQHEKVIQLQREKEKLALSYSIEKEQVSKIVQLLVSDKEEMQQQLTSMKDESELKSQQIETYNTEISHLSNKIEVLSSSIQEKEATAAQLQNELQTHWQVSSTQLLGLTTQIAELEHRLQEAVEQKQQVELEKEATVQEMNARQSFIVQLHAQLDEPPKITNHPNRLSNVFSGKPVTFTAEATGTGPLNYHWEWKPAEEKGESKMWQQCCAEWSDGNTLTIPSVQKCNEGSYRCVISNYAGSQISNTARLSVAESPRITIHPHDIKNTVQGKCAKFTIQATGAEPLSYHWQWKLTEEESEEWQPCHTEWCDSATLTIPNVQKSNEGNYRCVVCNYAGSQTSKPAKLETCPPLQLPLQLKWRRCRDMDYAIIYPNCVVLERSVYVGGGGTGYGGDPHTIMKYNMNTDNWSCLTKYQYRYFAMTIINHNLILVGGRNDRKVTNQLVVYNPSSQDWTCCYHPMPTPCWNSAVLMYDIWLLVAGGYVVGRNLATVELLNTSTNQWLAASPLPTPCGYLKLAILQEYLYVVMNRKQVFCVSLPDIISQTVDQPTASKSPTLWCRLPDTPLENSGAITLHGYLLAVGGRDDNCTRTDIYLYQPESKKWTKAGDLPNAREYCSCVVLPSCEILVAGGHYSSGRLTSRVDVASLQN